MYRTCAAITLLIVTFSSLAQQSELTESMAIQLGLSRDTVQQMMAAKIAKAQSNLLSARTRPNPELHYERETHDGASDFTSQTFAISQQFDFSGRRSLHEQASEKHLQAAEYESNAIRADLIKNIRQHFFNTLLQQQQQTVLTKTHKRIEQLSQILNKRRQEGDVSIYDYQRVKTESAAIEVELNNTVVDLLATKQQLSVLTGDTIHQYKYVLGVMLPAVPAAFELLAPALKNQPALLQLKRKSDAYAMQQRAENRSFPEVTLGLGVIREEDNNQSEDGLVINASIPLPVTDTRKDKQTHFQAQALAAQSEYQMALDNARAQLKGLEQQVIQYRRSAITYRKNAVTSAEKLIEVAEAYYRAGELGILELLDAYRSAMNAELTALELEHKARLARIKLDHLMGGNTQ